MTTLEKAHIKKLEAEAKFLQAQADEKLAQAKYIEDGK